MGGRGAIRDYKSVQSATIKNVKTAKRGTAADKITKVLSDLNSKVGYSRQKPFAIGLVEKRMADFASENNIELSSKSIYMSTKSISHSFRKTKKKKGLAVSEKDLIEFPLKRRSMDLFYDGDSFIYTDYKNKYIIHPSYEVKKNRKKPRRVAYVSAGKVTNPDEFIELKKYIKVN